MKTILVIEDDLMTRKLLTRIIQSMGHAVVLASNGKRGIETLKDNIQINLVLTNMQMPEMDGMEVLTTIKKNKSWHSLPVIVYSAYIKLNQIASLLDAGASAFIAKPIQKKEIEENIDRYLL
jgi:CheY-like chemotaxis protein